MDWSTFPPWAKMVFDGTKGINPKLFLVKKAKDFNLLTDPNMLVFDEDAVKDILMPYLTDEEKEKSLRSSGGLDVKVYVKDGWLLDLFLFQSNEGKKITIEGEEMNYFQSYCDIEEKDEFAIWIFQGFDGYGDRRKFCFMFMKAS